MLVHIMSVFSKCSPWTRHISITWERVINEHSWAPPRLTELGRLWVGPRKLCFNESSTVFSCVLVWKALTSGGQLISSVLLPVVTILQHTSIWSPSLKEGYTSCSLESQTLSCDLLWPINCEQKWSWPLPNAGFYTLLLLLSFCHCELQWPDNNFSASLDPGVRRAGSKEQSPSWPAVDK